MKSCLPSAAPTRATARCSSGRRGGRSRRRAAASRSGARAPSRAAARPREMRLAAARARGSERFSARFCEVCGFDGDWGLRWGRRFGTILFRVFTKRKRASVRALGLPEGDREPWLYLSAKWAVPAPTPAAAPTTRSPRLRARCARSAARRSFRIACARTAASTRTARSSKPNRSVLVCASTPFGAHGKASPHIARSRDAPGGFLLGFAASRRRTSRRREVSMHLISPVPFEGEPPCRCARGGEGRHQARRSLSPTVLREGGLKCPTQ